MVNGRVGAPGPTVRPVSMGEFRQIKQKPFRFLGRVNGACGRTRTGDLRITNALLYQLSHASMPYSEKWPSRSQLFQYNMVLKIRQDFF